MPKWWQRVTFDAAMNKKRPTFAQLGDIDTASFFCGGHLLGDRRDIIDRFAGQQTSNDGEECKYPLHFSQNPMPKIVRIWKSASSGVFVACARAVTVTNQFR